MPPPFFPGRSPATVAGQSFKKIRHTRQRFLIQCAPLRTAQPVFSDIESFVNNEFSSLNLSPPCRTTSPAWVICR